MDERTCTGPCGETLPLDGFAKDARLKSGRRSRCKRCDRAASEARRQDRAIGRRPGALVLVPKFPAPPENPSPLAVVAPAPTSPTERPGGAGSYAEAAEKFIAALDPPAGPADALLVRNLRGLAELIDRFSYGPDVVKDVNSLTANLLRVQRELAATRLAKAKPEAGGQAAPKSKLGRFSA